MDRKRDDRGMSSAENTIIDVVAPGFSFDSHSLLQAKQVLKAHGVQLRIPQNLKGKDLLFANSDKERWLQLKRALRSTDSKYIWCVRGGSGSYRLLPQLRAELKKAKHPKTIIGYSDITSLLNLVYEEKSWPQVHGPLLENVAQPGRASDISNLLGFIHGRPLKGFTVSAMNSRAQARSRLSGIARGGNLCVLCSHLGTPFAPHFKKGSLLFLEDIGERAYKLDKMLWQLQQLKSFGNVSGLIFGEFIGGKEKNGKSRVQAFLKNYAEGCRLPVFHCKQFGHGKNKSPILIGSQTRIEKKNGKKYQVSFS